MRIADLYDNQKTTLSFVIFPPKKNSELKNIDATLEILCELKPDFISVTFGAGMSYALSQIIDLLTNDVKGIHLYTMNNPAVADKICQGIKILLYRKLLEYLIRELIF